MEPLQPFAPRSDLESDLEGEDVLNPPPRYNRPGQAAIGYRAATHPEALRRLLARLPAAFRRQLARPGGAGALTTRAPDDPSIALLDAWAAVLDVIAFYQERIANEGFLATATERRSVLELARTIGYELAPGVAAGAHLAFTVEPAAGAPGRATIDPGVRVLSVPGQGERPQTFETVEGIEARATWNALRPRQRERQRPGPGATDLYLSGTTTLLGPGDPMLLAGDAGSLTAATGRERRGRGSPTAPCAWSSPIPCKATPASAGTTP